MLKGLKNINECQVLNLRSLVEANEGEVISKTLSQNENVSLTLFAFAKNEEISTHQSQGDALVTILEGEAKITIDDQEYILKANESIVMPAFHPHAVLAIEKMKMLLVVVFND